MTVKQLLKNKEKAIKMSEEKLYMVKNDEGEYWDFGGKVNRFWSLLSIEVPVTDNKEIASTVAKATAGHVVTLIEEPEKEAVSESVGGAIDSLINADTYVQAAAALNYLFASRKKKDIKRIIKAVRNGYTVKKKKYRVLAPKSWWYAVDAPLYLLFSFTEGMRFTVKKDDPLTVFTKEQLSAFGLDGEYFKKEEVTDDEPNYLDEYDAALPDDIPVIPNAVGEWIKKCKMNNVTLADMLCMEMRPQAVKWWMAFRDGKIANGFDGETYRCRQETMAKAWIQDAWIESETGEIVHL